MSIRRRGYDFVILSGIGLFIIVLLLLLTSPELLFSPVTTFIDTELYRSSGNEASVVTKMDFGSQQHMLAFPRKVGKWEGYDYDTTKYVELLGADIMLLRSYEPSTFSQPVFFLILQAKTESSFHTPEICVHAQGGQVQETGDEKITVTDATWVKGATSISIPMKKLVVTKSANDGTIKERRIMLFCYVKGNQFYSDTITMIQVEALAPIEGSYEATLNEEKNFISQSMPLMFEPAKESEWHPLVIVLSEKGIVGYIIIAAMVLLPAAIIIYPRVKRKKDTPVKSEP
jgi:hypothetical protein